MKRRDFIGVVGALGLGLPFAARAQQTAKVWRIGFLAGTSESNPEAKGWIEAFREELSHLGWKAANIHIDSRWTAGDVGKAQSYAAEIIALNPDIIVAHGTPPLVALHRATTTIPIVFVRVPAIIELGLVGSMAHPGGNITGFTNFDYPIASKWLELLHQLAPQATNIGVLIEAGNSSSDGYSQAIRSAVSSMQVAIEPLTVDTASLQSNLEKFARQPNRALIVLPNGVSTTKSKRSSR